MCIYVGKFRWPVVPGISNSLCVILTLLIAIAIRTVYSQIPGDECDWTGSGVERKESLRGVQPVYLRCAQGKVQWMYPRGGLRVILRMGTSGRDFRGCVRVARDFQGARVYLEGHRTLHLLYSPEDGRHPDLVRCFNSYKGQVALYIEAEPVTDQLKKDVAAFSYDLKAVSAHSSHDTDEECRPCTDDELLRLYCTSDFVASGSISNLVHNDALERTELTVRTKRVLRESVPVFSPEDELDIRGKFATLHLPLSCQAKHGSGEFLFIGRVMLDSPVVTCAPRLEDWETLKKTALKEGSNQCQLD